MRCAIFFSVSGEQFCNLVQNVNRSDVPRLPRIPAFQTWVNKSSFFARSSLFSTNGPINFTALLLESYEIIKLHGSCASGLGIAALSAIFSSVSNKNVIYEYMHDVRSLQPEHVLRL